MLTFNIPERNSCLSALQFYYTQTTFINPQVPAFFQLTAPYNIFDDKLYMCGYILLNILVNLAIANMLFRLGTVTWWLWSGSSKFTKNALQFGNKIFFPRWCLSLSIGVGLRVTNIFKTLYAWYIDLMPRKFQSNFW